LVSQVELPHSTPTVPFSPLAASSEASIPPAPASLASRLLPAEPPVAPATPPVPPVPLSSLESEHAGTTITPLDTKAKTTIARIARAYPASGRFSTPHQGLERE
jgi:hypothetical protein